MQWSRASFVLAACLAAASSCGRSGLGLPSSAGEGDAGPDAPPLLDAGLAVGSCPAALLAGSPAPITGYCPTRAFESAFAAPTTMELLWTLSLSGSPDPADTVILTPAGRAYVRVDTNDIDSGWIPDRLVAIDPGGAVAFERDFDGSLNGTPVLAADGSLVVLVSKHPKHTLLALASDGTSIREETFDLPLRGEPAIGADGTLYFLLDDWNSPVRILALAPDFSTRWISDEVGQYPRQLATGRDGTVLVASRRGPSTDFGSATFVSSITATGALAWETQIADEAQLIDGPAVGPDGAIHVVLWTEKSTRTTLVVLEPGGALRHAADVQEVPWGGGVTLLAVGGDGAAYVKAGEALTALDAQGTVRWKRAAHPNVQIALTIDGAGTVLVSAGTIEALDPLTGEVLSTFEGPPSGPGTIYFSGGATLGDGAFFFTDYGGKLYAVGAK